MNLTYIYQNPFSMKRIIVPTDFSFSADKACEYGFEIAAGLGAEMVLMHAFQQEYRHPDMPADSYDMVHDDAAKKMETIRDAAKADPRYADVKVTIAPFFGSTRDMIDEAVKQYNPMLIIMGTEGATNLQKRLFGTNTQNVAHDFKIPVLAIPKDAEVANLRNFILAADYFPGEDKAIEFIRDFSRDLKAHLTIMHVGDVPEDLSVSESAEGMRLHRIIGEEVKHDFQFVENDDVTDGIEEYLDHRHDAGLLIMISHDRSDWLERILIPRHTNKVLDRMKIPTLIVDDEF